MSTQNDDILSRLQRARTSKPKKVYEGPKAMSDKKKAEIAEEKKALEEGGDPTVEQWFQERRMEMTGKCFFCGGKTEKWNDELFRASLHHLFEKNDNAFQSVKTHPDNCIEVCHYGNSCHSNLHNGNITWEIMIDSAEWPIILEKVRRIVPYIASIELRHIPDVLRPFIKDLLK